MTYLQTHKRPYQRRRQAAIIAIVAIVVIVLGTQLISPRVFPGLFSAIARPFWRTEFSIGNGALSTENVLLNDKAALERQLTDLQVRLGTIDAIEAENAELKTLLGREALPQIGTSTTSGRTHLTAKSEDPGILAAVLKRPPLSPYDEIIIDIGSNYGLSTTSLVYVPGNVLVGQVVDVLRTTAKVRFYSSSGESHPVFIGVSHAVATAVGRGGGQYEAQVARDVVVNEGDMVLSSGFNDRAFGIVSAVLLDPTQPFKTVLFAPPVNIYQLRWVLVKI
jgi:cell shape-determining protein MreC